MVLDRTIKKCEWDKNFGSVLEELGGGFIVSRGQTPFSFLLGRGEKRVWYTSVTEVVLAESACGQLK